MLQRERRERQPLAFPAAPLSFRKGGSGSQRKYFFFVVYFSWHWKHFSFPPGCSNSHLLTAFHAGLQLTPGRYLTMLPLK
jgi:hypothetical protein